MCTTKRGAPDFSNSTNASWSSGLRDDRFRSTPSCSCELEILSAIGSRRRANRAAVARPIRAGARPFTEQDAIANLDVDRDELAALVAAAGSNGDDLALLRLLLGGVGNDDATSGLRLGIDSLDDNAVVKRSEFNWCSLTFQAAKLDITLQAVLWGVDLGSRQSRQGPHGQRADATRSGA